MTAAQPPRLWRPRDLAAGTARRRHLRSSLAQPPRPWGLTIVVRALGGCARMPAHSEFGAALGDLLKWHSEALSALGSGAIRI